MAHFIYRDLKLLIYGPPHTFYSFENVLKKLLNIFSNFSSYLKVQSFRLIMENNFIQVAASAGHAHTIVPIFKHIIDCVQLYFTNGFMNIILLSVNCLWLVGITLIFNGTPHTIVQRCQIAASRWPDDVSSAADNAIFKNRTETSSVASAVWHIAPTC